MKCQLILLYVSFSSIFFFNNLFKLVSFICNPFNETHMRARRNNARYSMALQRRTDFWKKCNLRRVERLTRLSRRHDNYIIVRNIWTTLSRSALHKRVKRKVNKKGFRREKLWNWTWAASRRNMQQALLFDLTCIDHNYYAVVAGLLLLQARDRYGTLSGIVL